MREIVHIQAGQCGNQIGAKVSDNASSNGLKVTRKVIDLTWKRERWKEFRRSGRKTRRRKQWKIPSEWVWSRWLVFHRFSAWKTLPRRGKVDEFVIFGVPERLASPKSLESRPKSWISAEEEKAVKRWKHQHTSYVCTNTLFGAPLFRLSSLLFRVRRSFVHLCWKKRKIDFYARRI